ncbi:MAG: choice-of-anchor D domain-containing protein [Candidatus Brocadiaceae bacterium]|nr:choice-of-anchor D domain-containing protein [Candidatus Brocadiaceae bacterium]
MEKLVSVIRQGNFLFVLLLLATWVVGCAPGNANLVPAPTITDPFIFGDVYVGTTKSGTISWVNNGTDPADMIAVHVNTERAFTASVTTISPSVVINPGQTSPNVNINFTPTRTGPHRGRASPIFTGGPPTSIGLRGNGVAQKALGALSVAGGNVVAGQVLDFGNVLVGRNATRTFNIQNSSANAITVNVSWSAGTQGFSVTAPAGGINVPANGSVTVTITFTPAAVGTFTDAGTFSDAGGTNLAGTAVKGNGIREE